MNDVILMLQQVDSLLAETKYRKLLLQALTNSSVLPTAVNLPLVSEPPYKINCLIYAAHTDFPNFDIWELNTNNFRHIWDIPINLSAIFIPIVDPMHTGYSA